MKNTRREVDQLGEVIVPIDNPFGAHTWRGVQNFPVELTGYKLGDFEHLVRSLISIKLVCANANRDAEFLPEPEHLYISRACTEILGWKDYRKAFPVHILQGGGGTSSNMNANEVIANLANSLASEAGQPDLQINSIDHVNLNQSTNDVYPSASNMAISIVTKQLTDSVDALASAYHDLRENFGESPRLARTCLQDAVGTTFDELFGAYELGLSRNVRHLEHASYELRELSLGGGIVGQVDATPAEYRAALLPHLHSAFDDTSIRLNPNNADAAQNADSILRFASELEILAHNLIKQARDLRFLSSGPEAGIGEVFLPVLQAGSSAMPGKVNPVMPEFVIHCSIQTIAAVSAVRMATDQSELDLNVWEGVYNYNLLSSVSLLNTAITAFTSKCIVGLEINEELNLQRSQVSTAKLTKIAQATSYSEALSQTGDH
jgi:aspartate ammonia-lyase